MNIRNNRRQENERVKQTKDLYIYIAKTDPLNNTEYYQRALDMASPERRMKTLRFHFLRDRKLSLTAELLLRKALLDRGLDSRELHYGYYEHEKPYLTDHPGFCYNLSHSGEYVMAAASGMDVGCDIEQITDIDLEIAKRFFYREEYDHIARTPLGNRNDCFFRYWTLKESFMKVTGLGFTLSLDDFQIEIKENGKINVRQSVDELTYAFAECDSVPGYRCAVCTAGEFENIKWQFVDLKDLLAEMR